MYKSDSNKVILYLRYLQRFELICYCRELENYGLIVKNSEKNYMFLKYTHISY